MLLLIPFLLLILSAITILVVNRLHLDLGRIWLTATLLSWLNWLLIFGFRWLMPLNLTNLKWFPFSNYFTDGLQFSLDEFSWPFALALVSIQLGVLLTDSARLKGITSVNIWAGIFIFNAIGYLAILSISILAIIFLWTLIDIVELLVILFTVKKDELLNIGVISFAVKITGTLLIVIAIFVSNSQGLSFSLGNLTGYIGFLMLAAISLRSGVIPFNLPYSKEIPLRIGLGNTMRMAGVATSLIVLIRIVPGLQTIAFQTGLLFFASLAALFASLMWVVSPNEFTARPFWIIIFSSLAIFSALTGNQIATLIWSLDLLLSGSAIFLYSERNKRILFLPLLAIIGFSGLPFTPSAAGWAGLLNHGSWFFAFINTVAVILSLLGYLRHSLRAGRNMLENERWIWFIFPLGLFILLSSQWLIFLFSGLNLLQTGNILASTVSFFVMTASIIAIRRLRVISNYSGWMITWINKFGEITISILSLNWLYKVVWGFVGVLQRILNFFSRILEGQAGFIWVLILVAAIITVMKSGLSQ